jgi:hypothetical protein
MPYKSTRVAETRRQPETLRNDSEASRKPRIIDPGQGFLARQEDRVTESTPQGDRDLAQGFGGVHSPTVVIEHDVHLALVQHSDPIAALAEARRVLRAGGSLRFVEHGRSPDPGVAKWHDRLTPLWTRCSGGCHKGLWRPLPIRHTSFAAVGDQSSARHASCSTDHRHRAKSARWKGFLTTTNSSDAPCRLMTSSA